MMDIIVLKFNKKNEAQITKRFEIMYNLLSEKTWMKDYEAKNASGIEVDAKDNTAASFCLIGAVRHVNGPTEEEIIALISLAIAKKNGELDEAITSYIISEEEGDENISRLEALFGVYDDIVTRQYNYINEDIIPTFNDDKNTTLADVKQIIKDAQKLYPKMMKLYEKYHVNSLKVNKLKKEMNNLKNKMSNFTL